MIRIVAGSCGSFLCPPGHPAHEWEVIDGPEGNPRMIAALDYAVQNEHGDVPPAVQQQARKLVADAALVRSELWERGVYGYFRGCYSPDGVDRNVQNAVIYPADTPADELPPPERHLAYLLVRSYFPDAEPRPDLLNGGGWGTTTCAACGERLQYEAKVDAFAEPITAVRRCPAGGEHYPAAVPVDAVCPDCGRGVSAEWARPYCVSCAQRRTTAAATAAARARLVPDGGEAGSS